MLYYVCYYPKKEDIENGQNLAGTEKANYIIDCFADLGKVVTVLSNAKTLNKKRGYKSEDRCDDTREIKIHTFSSLRQGNLIWNVINDRYGLLQLFFYILLNVNKNDIVCVYHSLAYRGIFAHLKRIKRFKYILEVEELYQYFTASKSGYKKNENKIFSSPDAFIFSNKLIADDVNIKHKKSAVVSGVYKNEETLINKEDKDKSIIKLVYAGSLEYQKGVSIILDIAYYLREEFELRIIGFGTDDEIELVKNRIVQLNNIGKRVIYDGIKTGDMYKKYIQECDIGLCIQDDKDIFNRYGFPSKVISYLANGLDVICNDLIQIKTSNVINYVNIVESSNAIDIANYINNYNYKRINARNAIRVMDDIFHQELKLLVEK